MHANDSIPPRNSKSSTTTQCLNPGPPSGNNVSYYYVAGARQSTRPAGPKITLHFPRLLVYIFVCLHLSRAQ